LDFAPEPVKFLPFGKQCWYSS